MHTNEGTANRKKTCFFNKFYWISAFKNLHLGRTFSALTKDDYTPTAKPKENEIQSSESSR